MAPAPSTASTSASTITWSADWQEAKPGDNKAHGAGEAAVVAPLCSASTTAESGRSPRESDEDTSERGSASEAEHRHKQAAAAAPNSHRDAATPASASELDSEGHRPRRRSTGPQSDFEWAYQLSDDVLGTGASGSVRQAVCRRTGRRVAVKSFNLKELSTKTLVNLEREVEVHTSVEHPGIVSLEAVFESEERIHLVLERLNGGELFDRLLERGRFTERETAKVCVQLLRTLAYLHASGVMHRDLKPENIMYTEKGGEQIKLIDFGFSTRFEKDRKLVQRCGTLQYVAPEVLTGFGYDEKSDMWSLGSVCYTLLTMKAMYSGNDAEIQRKNRLGAVDFSRTFKTVSPSGQEFVRSLLSVDAAHRPSAEEALQHPWLVQQIPELVAVALAECKGRHAGEAARCAQSAASTAEPSSPLSTGNGRSRAPRLSARLDKLLADKEDSQQMAPSCFEYAAKLLAPLRRGSTRSAVASVGARLIEGLVVRAGDRNAAAMYCQ